MASKGVNFRRGTTAQHSLFTGGTAELTVDTDKKVVIVHDNAKQGGYELVGTAVTQTLSNKEFSGITTFADIETTNLNVSGVSTYVDINATGMTTVSAFNVTGISTFDGVVGIETHLSIAGVSTFNGGGVKVTGVTTSTVLEVTGFSTFSGHVELKDNLIVAGVSTFSSVAGLNVTGITTTTRLNVTAGTASTAPIGLTTGTNLTTPYSGAIEYDGNLIYATPKHDRGVILTPQYYLLDTNRTGPTAATTPVNIFPVTATLKAGTRYLIEFYMTITKSAATSCPLQLISTSASGTIDRSIYRTVGSVVASATRATLSNAQVSSNEYAGHITAVTVVGGNATANNWQDLQGRIWVDVNSAADVTGYSLQVQFTAVPTTSSIAAGANISIYPMGPVGGNTSIGSWA